MTTFNARIRQDYSSVEGLVMDCKHSGLAADGSLWTNEAPAARALRTGTHTGVNNAASLHDEDHFFLSNALVGCFVWNVTDGSFGPITSNTDHVVVAVLAGGADNDWDTGDTYQIFAPRFGNPYQETALQQPVVSQVGGIWQADFTKADSSHLIIPAVHPFLTTDWIVGFDYATKAAVGTDHYVLGFPNMDIHRQDAAGNFGFMYNGINVGGMGDLPARTWLTVLDSLTPSGEMWGDNVSATAGGFTQVAIAAGDAAGFIGSDDGVTNFCDIILRGMHMWRRHLSPLERDFVFDTMGPGGSFADYARATISLGTWTDATGTSPEVSRLNSFTERPQRFYIASVPTGTYRRIQIAASVDGLVLPDTLLGGDLFDIDCIEHASPGVPHIFQDAGWSAVFDVQVKEEGHYTFVVHRDNGGSMVLHLDVIEV
jgi:hypothetical protein